MDKRFRYSEWRNDAQSANENDTIKDSDQHRHCHRLQPGHQINLPRLVRVPISVGIEPFCPSVVLQRRSFNRDQFRT